VLGMVENMSHFIAPDTGQRYDIFGSGGAKQKAAELDVPFLGEVPLNMQIRINGDEGRVDGCFDDPLTAPYLAAICHRLVKNLSKAAQAKPSLPSLSVLS